MNNTRQKSVIAGSRAGISIIPGFPAITYPTEEKHECIRHKQASLPGRRDRRRTRWRIREEKPSVYRRSQTRTRPRTVFYPRGKQ